VPVRNVSARCGEQASENSRMENPETGWNKKRPTYTRLLQVGKNVHKLYLWLTMDTEIKEYIDTTLSDWLYQLHILEMIEHHRAVGSHHRYYSPGRGFQRNVENIEKTCAQ
jgi:TFIIF-interacting CTD phosphatase-like protein